MAHEAGAVAAVPSAQSHGHESFHCAAQQFFARITEESFGLKIHEDDMAFLIDEDDSVRGRFRERAKNGVTDGLDCLSHKKPRCSRLRRFPGTHSILRFNKCRITSGRGDYIASMMRLFYRVNNEGWSWSLPVNGFSRRAGPSWAIS